MFDLHPPHQCNLSNVCVKIICTFSRNKESNPELRELTLAYFKTSSVLSWWLSVCKLLSLSCRKQAQRIVWEDVPGRQGWWVDGGQPGPPGQSQRQNTGERLRTRHRSHFSKLFNANHVCRLHQHHCYKCFTMNHAVKAQLVSALQPLNLKKATLSILCCFLTSFDWHEWKKWN